MWSLSSRLSGCRGLLGEGATPSEPFRTAFPSGPMEARVAQLGLSTVTLTLSEMSPAHAWQCPVPTCPTPATVAHQVDVFLGRITMLQEPSAPTVVLCDLRPRTVTCRPSTRQEMGSELLTLSDRTTFLSLLALFLVAWRVIDSVRRWRYGLPPRGFQAP
jgi:hypothetical protein